METNTRTDGAMIGETLANLHKSTNSISTNRNLKHKPKFTHKETFELVMKSEECAFEDNENSNSISNCDDELSNSDASSFDTRENDQQVRQYPIELSEDLRDPKYDESPKDTKTLFPDTRWNNYFDPYFADEDTCEMTDSDLVEMSKCEDQKDAEGCLTSSDPVHQESKKIRRSSQRKTACAGDLCCPVCGITLRPTELESHFMLEVEKLDRIHKTAKKKGDKSGVKMSFVRVKCNRENRLSAKVATYAERMKKEIQCPICKLRMSGCPEDINKHVALCVQFEMDEHIVVDNDNDDDESFEEFEIGDETRVRTISLVPGGHRSLEGQVAKRRCSDEDENLDVDVDSTVVYGAPQYTELDVIPNGYNKDNEVFEQLRQSVLIDPAIQPQVLELRKWSNNTDQTVTEQPSPKESSSVFTSTPMSEKYKISPDPRDDIRLINQASNSNCDSLPDQVVSALREKIKDMEDQDKSVKCLICMDYYTKPVVSTTCWHVHCEECWLMTLGTKKLCPQCNMIVFPSDLRKIFL